MDTKIIPRHSLIISVGANDVTRRQLLDTYFKQYEIIDAPSICYDVIGETDRPDLNSMIYGELRHRVALKLELGERAVVDAANLRREDRVMLARHGIDNGVPVFYMVCDPAGAPDYLATRFAHAEKEINHGDGLADVIDWRQQIPSVVPKSVPNIQQIRENWSGITVIADVHGKSQALQSALAWARSRSHYVIFLGDVLDYGPDSLETVEEVYRVVMRGEGELIAGNHERKIFRWLEDPDRQRLSEGNKVTTRAVDGLGYKARHKWIGRFRGLFRHAQSIRRIENFVFAHAGVHPGYWDGSASRRDIEIWAMFGEFQRDDQNNLTRKYDWVNSVPKGQIAIVGHDIRSVHKPLQETGLAGGVAVFLDTGSGKGGRLSSADLRIDDTGLKIENFNMY
jgi:hypothetical protein